MKTTLRSLAILALVAFGVAACLPIMVDRDGNWREPLPPGPAYESRTSSQS